MNGFRRNGIRYNGYKQAEKCDFVFVVCVYGANLWVGVCMSIMCMFVYVNLEACNHIQMTGASQHNKDAYM